MSQHSKSSNYNAATKGRYHSSMALTSLMPLDESKLSNSDKETLIKAQHHLKEANALLNKVAPNL